MSELSPLGPGITNYFKFIKWCFWVFFVLSLVYLPVLVMNALAPHRVDAQSLWDLSRTTAANLGGVNTTLIVPGCDSTSFHQNCKFEQNMIPVVYMIIDVFACILLLIGLLWLRAFEKKEEASLNSSLLNVADFSVEVRNLPVNVKFTEAEVRAHFAKVQYL